MYANWFRSQGNTGWYSQTYGGGWYMTDSTWIRAYGNKNIYTTGEIRGGDIHATDDVIADSTVVIHGKAAIGAGCATAGSLAQSSSGNGEIVQCKSGRWTAMGGYSTFTIVHGPTAYGFSNSLATCPSGYDLTGGGYTIVTNPYSSLPGSQSWPYGGNTWAAESTDSRVGTSAWALCAK